MAEYLRLPAGVKVVNVQTVQDLQKFSDVCLSAAAVAIDAEWQPHQTPCCTLLQCAVRRNPDTAHQDVVYLLDVLQLPQQEVAMVLKGMFRAKQLLKVGYGMHGDLGALCRALGDHGPGTVAVVEHQLELKVLLTHLRRLEAPGLKATLDGSLSAAIAAHLGKELDKQQQCSAWSERPLSQQQVQYAALDAHCLLQLLDHLLVHLALQPAAYALPKPADPPLQEQAAQPDGTTALPNSALLHQAVLDPSCAEASEPCTTPTPPVQHGCQRAAASLSAAAQHWAWRLRYPEGPPPGIVRALAQRHPHKIPSTRCNSVSGPPLRIPWQCTTSASEESVTPSPRFVCDIMCEGLARQLRLCGIDAASAPLDVGKPRHLIYRSLVEASEAESRVVLTMDKTFVAARYTDAMLLVKGKDRKEQLLEVLSTFNLPVARENLLSRCAKCNGTLLDEPFTEAELPAAALKNVPRGLTGINTVYWVCGSCHKLYWQGGQYSNALEHLTHRIKSHLVCS